MPIEFKRYRMWVRRVAPQLPDIAKEQAILCGRHVDYLSDNFHRGITEREAAKLLPAFRALETAMQTRSQWG